MKVKKTKKNIILRDLKSLLLCVDDIVCVISYPFDELNITNELHSYVVFGNIINVPIIY